MAEVYETNENRIVQNFNRNVKQFVQGKHYFFLQGEDLKEFKRQVSERHDPLEIKFAPQLYLWTERGANRHCKILETDKAWQVLQLYRQLHLVH